MTPPLVSGARPSLQDAASPARPTPDARMSHAGARPALEDAPAPAPAHAQPSFRAQVSRLRRLPTLPRLQQRILTTLDDPEIDFNHLAALIETDQSLSSQVLRLANSAFYSANGQSLAQVSRALLKLGTGVVRSVVVTSSVFDPRQVPLAGFWEHSLGCAVAAGALGKTLALAAPEELVAAGLLHDLGKIVLFKELPEAFEACLATSAAEGISFREAERRLLGVDHGEIADWLVQSWNFPPQLAEPITLHHRPAAAQRARVQVAAVHIADAMVRAIGFGNGGDPGVPAIDDHAWGLLGLDLEKLDQAYLRFDQDLDRALNYAVFA